MAPGWLWWAPGPPRPAGGRGPGPGPGPGLTEVLLELGGLCHSPVHWGHTDTTKLLLDMVAFHSNVGWVELDGKDGVGASGAAVLCAMKLAFLLERIIHHKFFFDIFHTKF